MESESGMRILLVEDNSGDARLVREALNDSMSGQVRLDWVARLDEAVRDLREQAAYDLILVDLSLPDSQGLDTFRSIRAQAGRAAIVVLSGTDDEAIAMTAIECGAHNYLVKGHIGGPLLAREIRYAISRRKVEEALRQAKELAEAASRTKDQFFANISHEIRTPLNAVVGMVGLALSTELTSEQREYLLTIESASTALLSIIDELLDFAKMEQGKLSLDPVAMNVDESLSAILDLLAPQAHSKGLELLSRIRPSVPDLIQCDPTRFRQIVLNLVGNAIKFTERGEVIVEVDALPASNNEVTLAVTVSDTGIGISPEKVGDIFLPFVQADGSTTRKYGGTGLGLSVSARLVELMGSRIEVKSELNGGSSFQFNLRLKTVGGLRPRITLPGADLLRGLRVLLVDGSGAQRRMLAELLADWQIECQTSASGKGALTALERARDLGSPLPIVVAGSHLQDMDGLTLARQIHLNFAENASVILMCTKVKPRLTPEELRLLSVWACLTKPIKSRELIAALLLAAGRPTGPTDGSRSVRQEPKSPDWRPLKILLAEDNPFNQRVALLTLEKRGHEIHAVANGRDAVAAIEARQFDVALMDVQMPDMDGFEATEAIRAKERSTGRHLVIIAMTAQSHETIISSCLKAGMDGYLPKPVQAEKLIHDVEALTFRTRESSSSNPLVEAKTVGPLHMDLDAALDRINGDRKMFGEMAGIFLRESPRLLRFIRDGIAGGDLPQAGNAAHNLKNWAAAFVAPDLRAAAERIEEQLDSGALERAQTCFGPLEFNLDQLADELHRFGAASSTV
jgi:two-component system sensor histidine kinase/response regulator